MCDIQLPFGRHHIHCNLFASTRHKFDSYWHGLFVLLVLCTASRASTFKILYFSCFGARHISNSINICKPRQDGRFLINAYVLILKDSELLCKYIHHANKHDCKQRNSPVCPRLIGKRENDIHAVHTEDNVR